MSFVSALNYSLVMLVILHELLGDPRKLVYFSSPSLAWLKEECMCCESQCCKFCLPSSLQVNCLFVSHLKKKVIIVFSFLIGLILALIRTTVYYLNKAS